jgi:type IV pilus assembly protein PilA
MLLQNIRARIGARLNGDSEAGFTLIELLVVMLILGILAAIALPSFFNQKEKATDSQAKAYAHSAQVAMETYSTDHGGIYEGVTPAKLVAIESTLSGAQELKAAAAEENKGYALSVKSGTGNVFSIVRNKEGITTLSCTTKEHGGCPASGNWGE